MAPIVGWLWPLEGPSGTSVSVGLLEEVGLAILLALVLLLWVVRGLRRRKSEEERRAIVVENRRKTRRLYEEAFGKGDFSVIDEVTAEGSSTTSAGAAVRRDSSALWQVFAAPSQTCKSRSKSRAWRARR